MKIPKSIRTERLFLRCWKRSDAQELLPVLKLNESHLKQWIPAKVAGVAPIPELEKRLSGFAKDFASGKEWRFAMFTSVEKILLGEASLFPDHLQVV